MMAGGPAHLDAAARRVRGAWYTPPALVDHVLATTLDAVLQARARPDGLRLLDPACGDGRFLAAAAARIDERFGPGASQRVTLVGVDTDAVALASARRHVPQAVLVHDDALARAWTEPFDVVVGNPPFLNQLAAATSRGGRSSLGGGPYADAAALFLTLALQVTAPGGRVGLVLPQSLLSTRDAAPLRAGALERAALTGLWWAGVPVFDAAVLVCAASFAAGAPQGPVARWYGPPFTPIAPVGAGDLATRPAWGHLVADAAGIPSVALAAAPTLASLTAATADFRDQYYDLVPHVRDDADGPPLVTAGLLDAGRCAWGERPARFGGRRWAAPRVDRAGLGPQTRAGRWAARRLVPKVLLATQTRVLEAAVDEHGAWLPSVPVVSLVPHDPADLWRVGAVLTSPPASAWAAATYFGAGLSSSAIKLSAAQVLTVPLPADAEAWQRGANALQAGDVDACGVAMCEAYGAVDDELLRWWRAGVQRSRIAAVRSGTTSAGRTRTRRWT